MKTQKCNAINYNVIFIDEIFTKKYLFYYCYVNLCYCVVCAAINLSIYSINRLGIHIQSDISHCFTPMEIPKFCFCWYIPEVKGIVPLPHGTIHGANYTQVYRQFVSIGIFQRRRELFPFFLILFMEQIKHGYTNGLFLSVYSRGEGNCSLHMSMMAIKVFILLMKSLIGCELQHVGT